MAQLPTSLKISALRGLGQKMSGGSIRSPLQTASNYSQPKMPNQLNARVKKEIDPDYLPTRKTILTGKLF